MSRQSNRSRVAERLDGWRRVASHSSGYEEQIRFNGSSASDRSQPRRARGGGAAAFRTSAPPTARNSTFRGYLERKKGSSREGRRGWSRIKKRKKVRVA
ncbi:hypothetical protein PUN28_012024 [Cardiocondyla obscurior]|uniref:Uncharacterized protein n=1 Tax=Cardiocondyla obscurior TaxID=286306 RepID=A0AAW2FBE4_9HYME